MVAHLPRPRVAVLLGGSNAVYTFSEATAARVGAQLANLADNFHAGLLVTPSRRPGDRQPQKIGRESCRERVWNTVYTPVVADSLKTNKHIKQINNHEQKS